MRIARRHVSRSCILPCTRTRSRMQQVHRRALLYVCMYIYAGAHAPSTSAFTCVPLRARNSLSVLSFFLSFFVCLSLPLYPSSSRSLLLARFFSADPARFLIPRSRELVVIPVFRASCRIFSLDGSDQRARARLPGWRNAPERERVLRFEILGNGEKSRAVFFVIARILSGPSWDTENVSRTWSRAYTRDTYEGCAIGTFDVHLRDDNAIFARWF